MADTATVAQRSNSTRAPNSPAGFPVIEILGSIANTLDNEILALSTANAFAKLYTGTQAFRRYSWFFNRYQLNSVSNLRGMVVDTRSKAVYDVLVENGEALDRYASYLLVAALAIELAKNLRATRFTNDRMTNVQLVLADVESAVLRTLAGQVTGPVDFVARKLASACGAVGVPSRYCSDIETTSARMDYTVESSTSPSAVMAFSQKAADAIDQYIQIRFSMGD
jgi:hypothetical protein